MIAALGLLIFGLGVLLVWDARLNRNPIDEVLSVFDPGRNVRPIDD